MRDFKVRFAWDGATEEDWNVYHSYDEESAAETLVEEFGDLSDGTEAFEVDVMDPHGEVYRYVVEIEYAPTFRAVRQKETKK